jgi:alcohol dehydrogenase
MQRHLEAAGVAIVPFSDFGENPDSAMIAAGARAAAPHRIDSMVAIGGGSSLDCAKGINFVLTNGGDISDYRGYGKVSTPLLPMIGSPTTAGTGSEAQSYAVLSDAATHTKMACGDPSAAFRLAILDPVLTMTAPPRVTAMAGIDALAHAVETAVTTRRSLLSDMWSRQAWQLLSRAFERVMSHPDDVDARAEMQLGAHFAGFAIEQSMLGAAHACANPLTARFDLPHGLALAILLPHVVRWNAGIAGDGYSALIGSPSRGAPDPDAAETLAMRLEGFGRMAGMPARLSDAGVPRDALTALAELAGRQWTGTFNPRPFDASGALEIYEACF